MRRISLVTAFLLCTASFAAAAPLTDYSAGKGSVDLTWSASAKLQADYTALGGFLPDDAKNKFGGALTFGLGNGLAFQYKSRQGDSRLQSGATGPLSTYGWDYPHAAPGVPHVEDIAVSVANRVQADEFNLLYKLSPGLSLFAGAVKVKETLAWDGNIHYRFGNGLRVVDPTTGSDTKSSGGYQLGFTATAKLADKITGWTTAGLGNKIEGWEVGIGYAAAENLDINLSYSSVKYKALKTKFLDFTLDSLTASGFGIGLTYKY